MALYLNNVCCNLSHGREGGGAATSDDRMVSARGEVGRLSGGVADEDEASVDVSSLLPVGLGFSRMRMSRMSSMNITLMVDSELCAELPRER